MINKNKIKFPYNLAFFSIKPVEKLIFVRHLSIALKSGLDIVSALDTLASQTSSKKFQMIIYNLARRVEQGESLSESLKGYKDVFTKIFFDIIYTGERGGTLVKNLEYLSDQLENEMDLSSKVKNALIYPVIIFGATIAVTFGLAFFVLPKIVDLYTSFGTNLPFLTQVILNFTAFMNKYKFAIVACIGLFVISIRLFNKNKYFKIFVDFIKLHSPIVNRVEKSMYVSRITRILGTLIQSGVPIQASLLVVSDTVNHYLYSNILSKTADSVQNGSSLYSTIKNYKKEFSPLASRMIDLGEKTGNLEKNLLYLADFYEKEVDNLMKNIVTLIEPLLLIIVGLTIGIIAVAIIAPIYQLTGSISRASGL